jgi:hypothetical protein
MNINLNAGGIVGGIIPLCVGFGLMFLSKNPAYHDHLVNVMIFGVIGGAFLGNFAWPFLVGTKTEKPRNIHGVDNVVACPMCGARMTTGQTICNSCGERPKDS